MIRACSGSGCSRFAWRQFEAEAAYAESILRGAIGDTQVSIAAAERALDMKPDYPPAILTMRSIEYQRGRVAEGARLFRTLLPLPDESGDLWELIDKAGDFLIQQERYAEGLELYEAAVRRFPDKPALYQGLGCCAGHEKLFDRALEVSRKALDLEPDRPDLTGDRQLILPLCRSASHDWLVDPPQPDRPALRSLIRLP